MLEPQRHQNPLASGAGGRLGGANLQPPSRVNSTPVAPGVSNTDHTAPNFNAPSPSSKCPSTLPSPAEVRRQANKNNQTKGVVTFPTTKGLIVKWGSDVRIAEGQTLLMLRDRFLKYIKADKQKTFSRVPVPEIFGWRTDGKDVFLYMEAINGETLEAWGTKELDHSHVCNELINIFTILRNFKQDKPKICNAAGGPIINISDPDRYDEIGPFKSVEEFHDHLCPNPTKRAGQKPSESPRDHLPDTSNIVFTHGDLYKGNIMLIPTGIQTPPIVVVVGWGKAAWLTDYWEMYKSKSTALTTDRWNTGYLPRILGQRKDIDKLEKALYLTITPINPF